MSEKICAQPQRSWSCRLSALEWPPIAAMAGAGAWSSAASTVYLPGGGSSWRGKMQDCSYVRAVIPSFGICTNALNLCGTMPPNL